MMVLFLILLSLLLLLLLLIEHFIMFITFYTDEDFIIETSDIEQLCFS